MLDFDLAETRAGREIFQEGIQLNAVKIFRKNIPNTDVLRIIKHNTRFPDLVLGDLNAQIAACKLEPGLSRPMAALPCRAAE
jgi:N-methylhydantoinase B/oxoprolinase/acetone carboxylase alpha subunit